MVDVGMKEVTQRQAIAKGRVIVSTAVLEQIEKNQIKKGNVLTIAEIAGIMGAKKTSDLIPLCHPIGLTKVEVVVEVNREKTCLDIQAKASCNGQTGVEMEALTAVSVAALTVYDMCKAIDKAMVIDSIYLVKKTGGKSGTYERNEKDIRE